MSSLTFDPKEFVRIFDTCIADYHIYDDVHRAVSVPDNFSEFHVLLYHKCWIDTVQWHLEDIIRQPDIDPAEALEIKRWIDRSNQERTDKVEHIDDYFAQSFADTSPLATATLSTETPAWAVDRLSILRLKIYHMQVEVERTDVSAEHHQRCSHKLSVLHTQNKDLCTALGTLLTRIANGEVEMKLYRQMKMYNDPSLNPMLYRSGSEEDE